MRRAMMNAIEIRGLKKSFKDFTLGPFDLDLPEGSIMGLVGENGAGKSTTIGLIMNALRSDEGTVKVLGIDNKEPSFRAVKEDIGIVLDEAYYPEPLTARKLGFIMKHTYAAWDEGLYEGYIKDLDLPMNKAFKDFSRGMKMKLAIAIAMSHKARLLILDEATSGLDPIVRDEILDVFNEFTRDEKHSILLSSHIVSDLEKVCDYIAFIHKGRLLFCEEKDRLLEDYGIIKVSSSVYDSLDPACIKGVKKSPYGVEALVTKSSLPGGIDVEHTSLEDVILFLAKGVN
jgi:ABC-2 type transport system ATP-binding protein